MKLGVIRKKQIMIEVNEEELGIIMEGLEIVADLKMLSDMDSLIFAYYRELVRRNPHDNQW
jgi:hypothetical protein